MATPLWFDKISILYEKKYLFEIIRINSLILIVN